MSAANRGTTRHPRDRYYTPISAIDTILPEINWWTIRNVCEPAAGDNRIRKRVESYGLGRNLTWQTFEIMRGTDYLDGHEMLGSDLVITNPPYSLAREYIELALEDAASVCMLLRLALLESQGRNAWWQDKLPSHLFVLSRRPSFILPDVEKRGRWGTDATAYAWFGWGNAFIRPPGVYVL